MTAEHLAQLRTLLRRQRVLALSVLVDERPVVTLMPFTLAADPRTLLVHASGAARQTRGLAEGAFFGALIHTPDAPDADPLQLPRVIARGRAHPLMPGETAYASGREQYLAKFPQSAVTFTLGDFRLVELRVEEVQLVGGVARAETFQADALRDV